jgi:Domain of unknown function (DUF1929)/Carbohydrate binding module (family 6)
MQTQSRAWTTHRSTTRFLPVLLAALIGLNACQTTPAKPGRKPFGGTAWPVAGVIQAEDFDEGGEGVSFHRGKPATISGPDSRNADVQKNADGSAELVGLEKGDWFEYTINVASTGQHDLSTRLKSPIGSGFVLSLDGNELGARIPTPYQGNADWIEIRTNGLEVPAGTHVLRVTFDGSGITLDQFEFRHITQPVLESVAINPQAVPNAVVNKPVTLIANLTGQGTFDRGLTWKVEPVTNATLTPNGEKATFTASAAGSYNITATSSSNPSKKSTVTVNASVVQAQSPADVGQWGPKFAWPSISIHAVVLPNGKIMSWDSSAKGDGYDANGQPKVTETVTWLWDPETDPTSTHQTSILNTHTNMFCAGHSLLPDGKLLVVGGHIFNLKGFPHTNTYDFKTSTWTAGPNTNKGRWYPTTLVLGNGDVLIANGFDENGADNQIPQIWKYASNTALSTLRTLNTGGLGEERPYFPMLYQIKNGLVFNAGPQQEMSILDINGGPSGNGQWTKLKSRDTEFRSYGSSVMFKPGQILVTGGSGNAPPTSSTTIIDTNTISAGNPNPTVTIAPAMAAARRQHNVTMLPNGEVIITGGTSGGGFNDNTNPVLFAESWDSNKPTQAFKKLPSMTVPRLYHSIALLLPDGRVLSSGGAGACNSSDPLYGPCNHPDAEIYTPAYLFNPNGTLATRPVIGTVPTEITYGGLFSFSTDTDIAKATLIKLSSVTHSQNFDQRIYDLTSSLVKAGANYTATAPTDTNTYAPGYYMLFGLNAAGVPSKAKILQLK